MDTPAAEHHATGHLFCTTHSVCKAPQLLQTSGVGAKFCSIGWGQRTAWIKSSLKKKIRKIKKRHQYNLEKPKQPYSTNIQLQEVFLGSAPARLLCTTQPRCITDPAPAQLSACPRGAESSRAERGHIWLSTSTSGFVTSLNHCLLRPGLTWNPTFCLMGRKKQHRASQHPEGRGRQPFSRAHTPER